MMCELLKQQLASGADVNVLEGNIKDYHDLMVSFSGVMEKTDKQFTVYKVGKECSKRTCQKLQQATYLF